MKEKWEIKKLGEVVEQIRGVSYKPSDLNSILIDGFVPLLRANNIQNKLVFDDLQFVSEKKVTKKQFIQKGDILICTSSGSKHLVGKASQSNENLEMTFGAFCKIIRPKNVNSKLIGHFFNSNKYRNEISDLSRGVNINNIKTEDIDNLEIPIPPLSVQQSIVAELDTLHRLKELQEQQLTEFDNLAQSTFYSLFGDPIDNEKGWEVTALGNHISVLGGYAFKSDSFTSDGIPVLKIGNINSGKLNTNNISFYPYDETLSKFTLIQGDLVISLTGTVGKEDYGNVCILPDTFEKYYLNQRNAKIEVLDKLNVIFLKYLMAIPDVKKQLTGISRGVRQANISNNDILSMKSIIPPLSLQTTFAERIEKIEAQKELVKRSIGETQTLIDYTMDKYFG